MSELSLTRHDGVARVTIDRPVRKHAWSAPMWTEMTGLMSRCAKDDSVRVVLVTSTGDRVFSAGADLEQFSGADPTAVRASLEGVESVMASIEACPKPVVAVVSGAAVGAGTEVAAACDVRIASDRAWFSIPAATLGIVITKSDIARLVRGVGASMARDMLLTGRRLTAFRGPADRFRPLGPHPRRSRRSRDGSCRGDRRARRLRLGCDEERT